MTALPVFVKYIFTKQTDAEPLYRAFGNETTLFSRSCAVTAATSAPSRSAKMCAANRARQCELSLERIPRQMP